MALTRVCIYTRISTDEENQPTSLPLTAGTAGGVLQVQEGWRIRPTPGEPVDAVALVLLVRDENPGSRAEVLRRLAEVGITDDSVAERYPFQLSGGMRQLVTISGEHTVSSVEHRRILSYGMPNG